MSGTFDNLMEQAHDRSCSRPPGLRTGFFSHTDPSIEGRGAILATNDNDGK
jgi:hypothetical protein